MQTQPKILQFWSTLCRQDHFGKGHMILTLFSSKMKMKNGCSKSTASNSLRGMFPILGEGNRQIIEAKPLFTTMVAFTFKNVLQDKLRYELQLKVQPETKPDLLLFQKGTLQFWSMKTNCFPPPLKCNSLRDTKAAWVQNEPQQPKAAFPTGV